MTGMRNCHHFPLSLQFLHHSLSDLHNRTHLSRTVCHALERNLQNLISKDKIRLAEKLFHHLAKVAEHSLEAGVEILRIGRVCYRINDKIIAAHGAEHEVGSAGIKCYYNTAVVAIHIIVCLLDLRDIHRNKFTLTGYPDILNRRRNQHCPSPGDRNTVAVPVGDRKLSGSGYKDGERVAVGEFHLYFAIDINKVGVEIGTLNQRSRGAGSSTDVHRAQICGSIVFYSLLCLVEMQLAQIAGGISPVVVENPVCDIARLLISTANMKGA